MKLVSAYANVTLESGLTKDQFKSAQKHCPNALVLKDEKGIAVFKLETGKTGCITGGGICYDNMTGDNKPFVSIVDRDMPTDTEKRTAYLNDTYGKILFMTKKVEDQVVAALAAIATDIETVASAIVVG